MSYLERLREIYTFEVESFSFLLHLGFSREKPLHAQPHLDEIEYVSKSYVFLIGMHQGRDENYRRFMSAQDRKVLTYPEVALKFFLEDYEKERSELEDQIAVGDAMKLPTLVEIELYKRHPWVFTTTEWVTDLNFVNGVAMTNQWFWKQENIQSALADYTNVLRSFRTEKTTRFITEYS